MSAPRVRPVPPARPSVRPLVTLVTLTLVASVLGVLGSLPTREETSTAGQSTPLALSAAATSCTETQAYLVDGSGRGWSGAGQVGGALRPVLTGYADAVRAAGSTLSVRHLGVRLPGAGSLVRRGDKRRAITAVTGSRARKWAAPVAGVRRSVLTDLRRAATACPEQSFLLAGHAQGASAVHRLLAGLGAETALRGRVVGAVLSADGDRRPRTRATTSGSPAASKAARGVVTTRLGHTSDVPVSGSGMPVVSVCVRGDLVCDLGRTAAPRALAAHATYAGSRMRTTMTNAGRRLAVEAAAWPRPVEGQRIDAVVGTPVTRSLDLRVGPAQSRLAARATGLPAGLSLSADGVVSGTPTTPGTVTVPYTVRGTSPVTSAATGSVVVAVAPGSPEPEPTPEPEPEPTPEPTPEPDPGSLAPVVSAGGQESCRIGNDGRVRCAGENFAGQIGDASKTPRAQLRPVGTERDWTDVDTSGGHTCGVRADTSLWCWGQNTRGQLGIGDGSQMWTPQQVGTGYAAVATGWLNTCAVRTDGTLWCWGNNDRGQVGVGDRTLRRTPTQVGAARTWASVTVGGFHACGVRTDGTAVCWGLNDLGQLGDGSTSLRTRPVRVAGDARFASVDASWSRTCGVTLGGAALCWGINDQGQLGDGTRTTRLSPTAVVGGLRFTSIDTGDAHTCGLTTDASMWCWGDNSYGQLGNGTTTSSPTPVRVLGGLRWDSVATGWMHTCGTTRDATLRCWGNNERGQLAQGDLAGRTTPPGVSAPAQRRAPRRIDGSMTHMSFNVLNSFHTAPGGAALNYAPGRIRIEWVAALVRDRGADVVGFQEMGNDLAASLQPALADTYDFYPKPTAQRTEVLNTVGWRRSEWSFKGVEKLRITVRGNPRTTHIVRLENRQTGRNIWVLNAHNSPSKSSRAIRERDQATTTQIEKILAKRRASFPVIFSGDMNDRESVFCKTTRRTDLRSVSGGVTTRNACRLPSPSYLDWIFVSPEFGPVQGFDYERSPRSSRITDHHVATARLAVPGA